MEVPSAEVGSGQAARSFAAGDMVFSSDPWVCSFKYQCYMEMCAYCFQTKLNKLKTCSHCRLHHYCDTKCQAADWKQDHRSECKMLREMNVNIRKLSMNVLMDYCGEFGFCTAEILLAKVVNKMKSGKKEQLAGLDGELMITAREFMGLLPYDPRYETMFKHSVLVALIWPTATLGSIPAGFDQLARKVRYNAFPMRDKVAKELLYAAGLFPGALYRLMTPVCWDINVTMNLRGRTLVVHATEDIVCYTGLKDLRQNEQLVNIFTATLPERQLAVAKWYLGPCRCNKCTGEYDAEINPLKCSTSGCSERIPSDLRALQPCIQCGAINDQRLKQLKALMERNGVVTSVHKNLVERGKLQYGLLLELDQAAILHRDAHFRIVLGINVLRFLVTSEKRFEDAWNLCPGLVACVRAIYPKYHLGRACLLLVAGETPCMWYSQVGKERVRPKWKDVLDAKVLEWLWESREIYRKLIGPDNQWEHDLTRDLQLVRRITVDVIPAHVYQLDADLLRLQG